jgi:hypothetical protein
VLSTGLGCAFARDAPYSFDFDRQLNFCIAFEMRPNPARRSRDLVSAALTGARRLETRPPALLRNVERSLYSLYKNQPDSISNFCEILSWIRCEANARVRVHAAVIGPVRGDNCGSGYEIRDSHR